MMGRARSADESSFLKVACRLQDAFASARNAMPAFLPPPPILQELGRYGQAFSDYSSQQYQRYEAKALAAERQELEAAIGYEASSSARLDAYLLRNVRLTSLYLSHLHAPPKPPVRQEAHAPPRRDTIVDVIVGVHVTLGGGSRSATAKLLNDGIPRARRAHSVDPGTVRNALQSFVQQRSFDIDRTLSAAARVGHQALMLDRIVRACSGQPHLRNLPAAALVDRLTETGALFRVFAMAEDRVRPPAFVNAVSLLRLLEKSYAAEIARRARAA